nr:superoxide dismutase [Streptomyces sp. NBC_01465]
MALGGAALLTPLGAAAEAAGSTATTGTAGSAGGRWPSGFPLPNGFQPEGIAIGTRPYAYVGSIAHGSVHRASLATGRGRTVVEGAGPDHPVIGLKLDEQYGRLFLCGGVSREIRVADLRTGRVVRSYTVGSEGTMVNDVVLTPGAAWFTDSYKAQLYRLPLGRRGELGAVTTVPLSGDWVQGADFTANGIARTPDGRALIVADTVADGGSLMRVDPRTGRARKVDIGALQLPYADGLLLLGRTLYVVQQQLNAIDVVELNEAGTRGRAVTRITDPAHFRIPTTAAAWGGRIYLPNARFDVVPTPDTDYDVVSVRKV